MLQPKGHGSCNTIKTLVEPIIQSLNENPMSTLDLALLSILLSVALNCELVVWDTMKT